MKIIGTAAVAAALVTVAVQSDPAVNPQQAASVEVSQTSLVVAQMPGDCCNDDFRQALPLWESPVDTQIVKP